MHYCSISIVAIKLIADMQQAII